MFPSPTANPMQDRMKSSRPVQLSLGFTSVTTSPFLSLAATLNCFCSPPSLLPKLVSISPSISGVTTGEKLSGIKKMLCKVALNESSSSVGLLPTSNFSSKSREQNVQSARAHVTQSRELALDNRQPMFKQTRS